MFLVLVSLSLMGLGLNAWAQSSPLTVRQPQACEILTVEGTAWALVAPSTNWVSAHPGVVLHEGDLLRTAKDSRATARLSDLCVLRINELTVFGVHPPGDKNRKPSLDLKSGSVFFYSREKPAEIRFRTPTASGAIRGTEFSLQADGAGETVLALLDGEVDLANEKGTVRMVSGEEGTVKNGRPPAKSPLLAAGNVIQWCLYYPAVVDLAEIKFGDHETAALRESIAAYRSGDLLQALALCPDSVANDPETFRIYRAAVELSVGRVDRASNLLERVSAPSTAVDAIRQMVSVVRNAARGSNASPTSAAQWLAQSYVLQSRAQLEDALAAARCAVSNAPEFGFAWVRVAELEFSLGNLKAAIPALERGLQISPRNAQAHSLHGFILAARNRTDDAIGAFNQAIGIDGGLGTAWLGRGLCRIRKGDRDTGRADMQVAAVLEPQRAIIRSYLGKAFEHSGHDTLARKELRLAKQLDPNDPTAWFYSALLNQDDNQLNDAILDLEKSQARNDNARLFRSRFQLDQDQAARQANQAIAYRDVGMLDFGIQEASKSVSTDYADSSGHSFLAHSYLEHEDLIRFEDRYAAALDDEWLVSRLLAPAGSSAFSKSISIREYSPFFVTDGVGLRSSTEYLSRGAWREAASQYGRKGNMDYAVDFEYEIDPGQRRNNEIEQTRVSAQTKVQLNDRDSVFFYVEDYHQAVGDVIQYYDQNDARPSYHASQTGLPLALVGFHREWTPQSHTLFLFSALHNELKVSANDAVPLILYYKNRAVYWVDSQPFAEQYSRKTDMYSAELQQIFQTSSHTLVFGGMAQTADYDAQSHIIQPNIAKPLAVEVDQEVHPDLLRLSLYGYDYWKIFDPLQLTLGASVERFEYPANIDTLPISGDTTSRERFLPKAGLVYTPFENTTMRAQYTRSLGSALGEDQIRLEPTLVGGINQTYSEIFPESVAGLVYGADHETWAVGVDQVLAHRTFLSVEGSILHAEGNPDFGALTNSGFLRIPDSPSSAIHKLKFEEKSLIVGINQLIDRDWSVGVDDRLSHSHLDGWFPQVPSTATNASSVVWHQSALLNQLRFHVNYNHPCGFFMRFESLWTQQFNYDYAPRLESSDFWQHNVFAGYRFLHRRAEVQVGVYNLTDTDYHLNPLSFYEELPRERTFATSLKLNF